MYKIIIAIFLLVPSVSFSDERAEKIETLMKAQGLIEMWQQQIEMGKAEGEKQAKAMINQLFTTINPNEEFKKKFETAFNNFIDKIQGNWSAQQIVEVWAKFYGPKFSVKELDQLITFYTSEIGQKDIKATKATLIEFTQYFQEKNKPIMETALNEYIIELRATAKECNCPKKK